MVGQLGLATLLVADVPGEQDDAADAVLVVDLGGDGERQVDRVAIGVGQAHVAAPAAVGDERGADLVGVPTEELLGEDMGAGLRREGGVGPLEHRAGGGVEVHEALVFEHRDGVARRLDDVGQAVRVLLGPAQLVDVLDGPYEPGHLAVAVDEQRQRRPHPARGPVDVSHAVLRRVLAVVHRLRGGGIQRDRSRR